MATVQQQTILLLWFYDDLIQLKLIIEFRKIQLKSKNLSATTYLQLQPDDGRIPEGCKT